MDHPNLLKLALEPCIPPLWASNGHAQTVLGHLLPSPMLAHPGKQIEITLSDGDIIVGFFVEGKSDTIVHLFHGLSGSSDADYIQRSAQVCLSLGHSVFMVNHRGCGKGAGLASHPYHSGRAEDLSASLDHAKKLFPGRRHVMIGFSLSGNALLLLLSGLRGGTKPDAAISVNAPINLESAAHFLKRGFNRIYDLRFVHKCKAEVKDRRKANSALPKYSVSPFSTLHDFDAIYTAPAGGFKSREDYYRSCSTRDVIRQITTPTIMITAKDDPFVDYKDYKDAVLSPSVHLHLEESGGHVGYLSRSKTRLGTHRWLDYAIHECLNAKELTS